MEYPGLDVYRREYIEHAKARDHYRPRNRRELTKQIKTMKPHYKTYRFSMPQLWAIRNKLIWELDNDSNQR